MAQYSLRRARAEDEAFARRLHGEAYRDVVTHQFGRWDAAEQDAFFEAKWEPSRFQLVLVGDEPVGAVCVTHRDEDVFVDEIQLLPAAQSQGIGSEILRSLLAQAEARGVPVRLRVLRENRARQLYERLGFVTYDETETHYLMERLPRG